MINLLNEEDRSKISRENIIDFEMEIIYRLGFELNFQCPITSMERFLRILNLDFKIDAYFPTFVCNSLYVYYICSPV